MPVKRIISILFCLLPVILLYSQKTEQDVLQLKNGSILYGKILENKPGEYVRIEIIGNNQLVLRQDEIAGKSRKVAESSTGWDLDKKVKIASALHFMGGSASSEGFSITPSYEFPFRMRTGIGTGIDFFDYQVLPVFADISYTVLKNSLSPVVYVHGGYSFPLEKPATDYWAQTEYKGGFLASVGAGIQKSFKNHNTFVFSLGYRYQRLKKITEYNAWYESTFTQKDTRIDHLNRIKVTLAFLFN